MPDRETAGENSRRSGRKLTSTRRVTVVVRRKGMTITATGTPEAFEKLARDQEERHG